MSNIKISSNLFLGQPELNRMLNFLDKDGFRKNILDNSSTFGLIRNDIDINFANAKVSTDADVVISGNTFKTIQHNAIQGIDKDGLFFQKLATRQIPVPNDGLWHWVRVRHQYTHDEKGIWNLSADGILTGTGGELTKILRGQPNFPSRVRFTNAQLNFLEYDVLEVTDDNNLVLNGVSFQAENNLKLSVVGTFTYGVSIQSGDKEIFNYDSCFVELVDEPLNTPNVAPSTGFVTDKTFYIARVKIDNGQVIVQDKRRNFWETKASYQNKDIDVTANPLIGVEAIKYNHEFTAGDKNIAEVAWTFRSANWSINTSTNTLTISTGIGGKYKSVNDFQNGDFDGWRLYAPDGTYSVISSSVLQGNAIDLKLNVLDVDHFSNDGGQTYLTTQGAYVTVAPNAEEIEVIFQPDINADLETQIQRFVFPINEKIGKCDVLVYNDPTCTYVVKYRYKNRNEYTGEQLIPSDTASGYYDETSFDDNGNILVPAQTHKVVYTNNLTTGFILFNLSPNAYKRFVFKVDKGDIVGVQKISTLTNVTQVDLIVGQSKNYLLIEGNISLTNDVSILISNLNQIDGNEFTVHFNCNSLALNGFKIFIAAASSGGTVNPLKTIEYGDAYQMKNLDNGISFKCTCDGGNWYMYQNYELGRPFEIIDLDGTVGNLFDVTTGLGKIKGLFGYALCDGVVTTINGVSIPNLKDRFIIGQSGSKASGTSGGATSFTLTDEQINHSHSIPLSKTLDEMDAEGGGGSRHPIVGVGNSGTGDAGQGMSPGNTSALASGGRTAVSILPSYYSVIKAKKIF